MKITRRNLREAYPLIKALMEGQMIQRTYNGKTWEDAPDADLTMDLESYRVKPQELELRPFTELEAATLVGCLFKRNPDSCSSHSPHPQMILGVDSAKLQGIWSEVQYRDGNAPKDWMISRDGGKSWSKCGTIAE